MKRISLALVLFACSFLLAQAQTDNVPICAEGDCSPAVFSIQLDEPLQPTPLGIFSSQRTEKFKQAYLSFQQIKNGYANNEVWQDKYDELQLGGKSCLRHYQLEAQFAREYVQNTDFKQFVDSKASNANSFVKDGFENSRKGLNLSYRMQNPCPEAAKEVEDKKGLSYKDFTEVYQKLGQELGYFDEKGNQIKPLDLPNDKKDDSKLSKGQQIEKLKDQVKQLPVGPVMRDKIKGVKEALGAARPKFGLLKGALGLLNSRLAAFLPGPLGLLSKINMVKNVIGALKALNFKLPFKGLVDKIGNLFKRSDDHGKKVEEVANKSQKLKDKFDDLTKQADDLLNKIDERTAAIDQLQNKLEDLAKKKDELQAKLEDKPRKILDELKQQASDLVKEGDDLANTADKESQLKDKLLEKLDEQTKAKEEVVDQLSQLEKESEGLTKDQEGLEKETKEVEAAVEEAQKQEQKADELNQKIETLKPEKELEAEIVNCETALKKLQTEITGISEKQNKVKTRFGGLLSLPGKLMDKLSGLKSLYNQLKLPKNGIPLVDKIFAKVDGLMEKATAIGSVVESLTGKKTKLQTNIEGFEQQLDNIKKTYDSKVVNLEGLKKNLLELIVEKSGLKEKLKQGGENAIALEAVVQDFVKRYTIFDEKSDCISQNELEKKIEDSKKEQEATISEVEELDKGLEKVVQEEEQLQEKTQVVKNEVEQETKQAEELKQEEEAIKTEYGTTDIKLNPVPLKEWAASFEVERPYWSAVFHPDDEVVEGEKGRYFEVQLKDADKNVKLLFGPGEYFISKSDFRKKYGSTIGSFVTEALHAMKKGDQQKVKLFIQGSADIAGQTTFSGKLDDQFLYEDISVLSQKADKERFSKTPIDKKTPKRNFRNTHLPDLRAQYLKEMIKVYSKKFDPIVLEGMVKDFKNKEERNAIIYLFIPEELISEYEKK